MIANMCLCSDLIRTLESPFDVASARMKWYYLYTLGLPLLINLVIYTKNVGKYLNSFYPTEIIDLINYLQYNYNKKNELSPVTIYSYQSFIRRDFNIALVMMFSIFMLLAFYSVIFAIKRLFRNGVSKKARAQFVYKHISYVIVILISW